MSVVAIALIGLLLVLVGTYVLSTYTVASGSMAEPYLYPGDVASKFEFDVVVEPGRLWVMGDYRSRSADSRAHLGDPGHGGASDETLVGAVIGVMPVTGGFSWISAPDYPTR